MSDVGSPVEMSVGESEFSPSDFDSLDTVSEERSSEEGSSEETSSAETSSAVDSEVETFSDAEGAEESTSEIDPVDKMFEGLLEVGEQQSAAAEQTEQTPEAATPNPQLTQLQQQVYAQQAQMQQMFQAADAQMRQYQQQIAQQQGLLQAYQQQMTGRQEPPDEFEQAREALADQAMQKAEQKLNPQIQQLQQRLAQYEQAAQQQQKTIQRQQQRSEWFRTSDEILNTTVFEGAEDVPPEVKNTFYKKMAQLQLQDHQGRRMSPQESAAAAKSEILKAAHFLLKAAAQRNSVRQKALKDVPSTQPAGGLPLRKEGGRTVKVSQDASWNHALDSLMGEAPQSSAPDDGIVEFPLY